MHDANLAIRLAERVAEAARSLGFESALIGAAALAVHRYTRATEDIDLAVSVDPERKLAELGRALSRGGLLTELRMPDDDDPLGGLLSVREPLDSESNPVEVVNFLNPWRPVRSPARDAIARAQPLPGTKLRCVTIEDLVALKLYAGGLQDHADVVQLLARNPEIDRELVRRIAGPYDRDRVLERLLVQADALAHEADSQRDRT